MKRSFTNKIIDWNAFGLKSFNQTIRKPYQLHNCIYLNDNIINYHSVERLMHITQTKKCVYNTTFKLSCDAAELKFFIHVLGVIYGTGHWLLKLFEIKGHFLNKLVWLILYGLQSGTVYVGADIRLVNVYPTAILPPGERNVSGFREISDNRWLHNTHCLSKPK